jgi:hypothetical protein
MALSESVKADLRKGVNIEWIFGKHYANYVVKPSTFFTSNCETVNELFLACPKYRAPGASETDFVMCAWLAVKHYDEFVSLVMNNPQEIKKKSVEIFYNFSSYVKIWCEDYDRSITWPNNVYELLQKLFDDTIDGQFNHYKIWSTCLTQAILVKDSERVVHLIDMLEFIDVGSEDKETIKNKLFFSTLVLHGDMFVEVYPQLDIEFLKTSNVRSLGVLKYMVGCGYEPTYDDLFEILRRYKVHDQKVAMDNFFTENSHVLNSANENQIYELFALCIKIGNLPIFKFLLENHNIDINKTMTIFCNRHNFSDDHVFYYISAAIWFEHYDLAVELMDLTDLSNASDEMLLDIFEVMIWSNKYHEIDNRIISRFTETVNLTPELQNKFLNLLSHMSIDSVSKCKFSKQLIVLVVKLGCIFDVEYFLKIMEFLEVDAFDYLLNALNLIPTDLNNFGIHEIVSRYHKCYDGRLKILQNQIVTFKEQQYVTSKIKQDILAFQANGKSELENLGAINKIFYYSFGISEIDPKLFVKLYKLCVSAEITNHEITDDLLERVEKVVKEMFFVVDKCYDHQIINENGGRTPEPIIWP